MIDDFHLKYRKIPITVSIKGNEGIRDFRFIIDTGASYSIINEKILKPIGYSKNDFFKTERLNGFAGNSIVVDFLKVKTFNCLGLIRRNFEIGAMEFSPRAFYDGILGIDFFLNHTLCIDFKKGKVKLDS